MAPQPDTTPREVVAARALLCGMNELSANACHDLLGPLNQAGALMALFTKRYRTQLDADADELLEFLQGSSARMERIVAGLRQYLEIAGRCPTFEPVDLNMSLQYSRILLEKAISESGAVIESDSLPVVSADAALMIRMFEILIGNAIKFRRPDTPPRIHVSVERAGEMPDIAVTDNGIGIGPEYCKDVFRPFLRLNGGKYGGAGLGLAMAKLIAEMHGGMVRIEAVREWDPLEPAEHSGGTCVRFTVRR